MIVHCTPVAHRSCADWGETISALRTEHINSMSCQMALTTAICEASDCRGGVESPLVWYAFEGVVTTIGQLYLGADY